MSIKKNIKSKINRPIQRKFWNYLEFLPQNMQRAIIRSKFEVDYNLSSDYCFKQADTEDEIRQALKIVHDSYVHLNYIDPVEAEVRFTKFHALPGTVIFIAKYKEEIIGTLSIIPDSALRLPCDITWSLDSYRAGGHLIAEISSLAIKKGFRAKRGLILFPICKLMFEYSLKILKLDGIAIATSIEVEPFYKHIFLFDKVVETTGQSHSFVKDNPSTCMYLDLRPENMEKKYLSSYKNFKSKNNLYEYLFKFNCPNIILPKLKKSIAALNLKDNYAKMKLISKNPELLAEMSNQEGIILNNLDSAGIFSLPKFNGAQNIYPFTKMRIPRFEVRMAVWIFLNGTKEPVMAQLIDVSDRGFQLKISTDKLNGEFKQWQWLGNEKEQSILRDVSHTNNVNIKSVETMNFVIQYETEFIAGKAEIRWQRSLNRYGCQILEVTKNWNLLIDEIKLELVSQLNSITTDAQVTDEADLRKAS